MQCFVDPYALTKALQAVERYTVPGSQGLSTIQGEIHDDQMTWMATDAMHRYQVTIPAGVQEAGTILIPAGTVSAYVAKLTNGPVMLSTEGNMLHVTVKRQHARFALGTETPPLDWPAVSDGSPQPFAEFPEILRHLGFATEKANGSRPMLQGIYANPVGNTTEWVATDGSRLSRWTSAHLPFPAAIFPLKGVQELARGNDMSVVWDNQFAVGTSSTTEIRMRMLAGDFPDYTRVIPKDFVAVTTVDAEALRGALGRLDILAQRTTNASVELALEASGVSLTVAGNGPHGEDFLEGDTDGNVPSILFNPALLLEALKGLPAGSCTIQFSGEQYPARLTHEALPHWEYIVLPLRKLT